MGLTLREVAARAGVSLETVLKVEHRATARPASVCRVAEALGLKPEAVSPTLARFGALAE
jgi:hypothetical protein